MPKRRGPAPKPSKLKLLQGNPGKRKIQAEPEPLELVSDKAPAHLGYHAKKLWGQIVPELKKLGLVTVLDVVGLEMACDAYQVYRDMKKVLELPVDEKEGTGGRVFYSGGSKYPQQRPEVAIAKQAADTFRAFMAEYGLSPSARTRLSVKPEGGQDDDEERFFGTG